MNWVVFAGDVMSILTVIGGLMFLAIYSYIFDWHWSHRRSNEFAWHLMVWVAAATALDVYRTWLVFDRTVPPEGEVFRLIVYALLFAVVYWRLVILFRGQAAARRDQHDKGAEAYEHRMDDGDPKRNA